MYIKNIFWFMYMMDFTIKDISKNELMKNDLVECVSNKKLSKAKKATTKTEIELTFKNFFDKNINLSDYKLTDLKDAAKSSKLAVSGSKQSLIDRIENHFKRTKKSIIISRCFRGWLVRNSFRLRGPAFRNRVICNNESDFITMEPIREISDENFFSYTDKNNFTYGFSVSSLMQLIKTYGKIDNPYNREKVDNEIINDIKTLYKISMILYPAFKAENEIYNTKPQPPIRNVHRATPNTNLMTLSISAAALQATTTRLQSIREKPIQQRMQDLFIDIDLLGWYTNSEWFTALDTRQYIRLYRCLYEIWNYRSQLSRETRQKISPLGGLFDGIFPRTVYQTDLSFQQIQNACTMVFESLIYSGVDEEHRKLGSFHALSALTVVSTGARTAMPWLYESIVY